MSDEMTLNTTALDWLRTRISPEAGQLDLASAYEFTHPLNSRRRMVRQTVERDESLLYRLEFWNAEGEMILEAPVARRVDANTPLWANPGLRGSVVWKLLVSLLDRFKQQGFAKAMYASEDALFRRWNVREIHLDARWDGLHVWVKSFGYLPKDPGLLELDYPGWARQRGLATSLPRTPAEYPKEFLASRSQLYLYKVLGP